MSSIVGGGGGTNDEIEELRRQLDAERLGRQAANARAAAALRGQAAALRGQAAAEGLNSRILTTSRVSAREVFATRRFSSNHGEEYTLQHDLNGVQPSTIPEGSEHNLSNIEELARSLGAPAFNAAQENFGAFRRFAAAEQDEARGPREDTVHDILFDPTRPVPNYEAPVQRAVLLVTQAAFVSLPRMFDNVTLYMDDRRSAHIGNERVWHPRTLTNIVSDQFGRGGNITSMSRLRLTDNFPPSRPEAMFYDGTNHRHAIREGYAGIVHALEVKRELSTRLLRTALQGIAPVVYGVGRSVLDRGAPVFAVISDGRQFRLVRCRLRDDMTVRDLEQLVIDNHELNASEFSTWYEISISDPMGFSGDQEQDSLVFLRLVHWFHLAHLAIDELELAIRAAAEPIDERHPPAGSYKIWARESVDAVLDEAVEAMTYEERRADMGGEPILCLAPIRHFCDFGEVDVFHGMVRGQLGTVKLVRNKGRWAAEVRALRRLEREGISTGVPRVLLEGKLGIGHLRGYAGNYCLVTDVRGMSLDSLEIAAVDEETLAGWVGGVGDVLLELERAGLVHGDIKPGNIVVASLPRTVMGNRDERLDGRVYLIDWEGLTERDVPKHGVANEDNGAQDSAPARPMTFALASVSRMQERPSSCSDDWESLMHTALMLSRSNYGERWRELEQAGLGKPVEIKEGPERFRELLGARTALLGDLLRDEAAADAILGNCAEHRARFVVAHRAAERALAEDDARLEEAWRWELAKWQLGQVALGAAKRAAAKPPVPRPGLG